VTDDFYSWKRHPITQTVMAEYEARRDALIEKLIEQTPNGDVGRMAEMAGAIKAYQDILDISVEETDSD
jgi:hypothetical protein